VRRFVNGSEATQLMLVIIIIIIIITQSALHGRGNSHDNDNTSVVCPDYVHTHIINTI